MFQSTHENLARRGIASSSPDHHVEVLLVQLQRITFGGPSSSSPIVTCAHYHCKQSDSKLTIYCDKRKNACEYHLECAAQLFLRNMMGNGYRHMAVCQCGAGIRAAYQKQIFAYFPLVKAFHCFCIRFPAASLQNPLLFIQVLAENNQVSLSFS